MKDPAQEDGVRVSDPLCVARVNYHLLISCVLVDVLDMLYCDGIETFIASWEIMSGRGTVEMSNEDYTAGGVNI